MKESVKLLKIGLAVLVFFDIMLIAFVTLSFFEVIPFQPRKVMLAMVETFIVIYTSVIVADALFKKLERRD